MKRWKKLPNGSKKNWNHVSDVSLHKQDSYLSLLQLYINSVSLPDPTQVVDARAGPGFKVTKPKKIKNSDSKKKSKLKKLHKLKRQSKLISDVHALRNLASFIYNFDFVTGRKC